MNKKPDILDSPETKPADAERIMHQASPAKRRPIEDFGADDEGGSVKKKIIIGTALLALLCGGTFVAKSFKGGGAAPQKQEQTFTTVSLPPPPPPPPPKPTPPPPEEKIVKKEMIVQDEVKEDEKKQVDETPPAPMATTSIKGGPGGDASLGSSGSANPFSGIGKKGGSQFGWYAGPVQSRVAEALRTNKSTRSAKLEGVLVKIWPDSNARISRVEFKSGSGQPATDDAIRQALLGLALAEPPPADMPLPIVLRLSARAGLTAQR